MKRHYKKYSDADIYKIANEVNTMSQLLLKLGLKNAGGNYVNMKKTLHRLKIDVSHWTGQGWSKDQQLKDWTEYTRIVHSKKHLIQQRGNICEICQKNTWNGYDIPLEIHHIDGNRTNNNYDNLKLVCCNCHAQTKYWRGKKNPIIL